ncbi:MAG: class I SAM-dependent methyltransferase [Pirellulales bacterium]|nr:class I SAM-dependent methyltransferase [Pirellulales bacterium]
MHPDELKAKVQSQFGASTEHYATSDVHARGESLGVLLEMVAPESQWRALDVATGAGHTALAIAPHVANVCATDLTPGMVATVERLAAERGIENLESRVADAEALPFDDASFDLVTCRLAFHHFPQPERAARQFARVLRSGGKLAFTDNVTVDDASAARIYNEYEKIRDPSHHCVLPRASLCELLESAGFSIDATRQLAKEFEFHVWADRQHVSDADKRRLLDLMRNIPPALDPLFQPRWADGTMYFSLWEIVLVATR